jgi:hypothetical protein
LPSPASAEVPINPKEEAYDPETPFIRKSTHPVNPSEYAKIPKLAENNLKSGALAGKNL